MEPSTSRPTYTHHTHEQGPRETQSHPLPVQRYSTPLGALMSSSPERSTSPYTDRSSTRFGTPMPSSDVPDNFFVEDWHHGHGSAALHSYAPPRAQGAPRFDFTRIIREATKEDLEHYQNPAYMQVVFENQVLKQVLDSMTAQTATGSRRVSATRPPPVQREDESSPLNVRFMAKQSWVKYEQQKDIANPTKAAAEAKKKLDPDGPPPEYLHYLEHKNGDVVTYAEVEAVRKSMKTQWFAWSRKGSAPTVWGEVDHELLTPFIEDIYAQHKFLSYCEHDWKLHKLAQTDYPAWYRTHGSKQRSCKVEDDVEPRHNSKRQKKRHRSPSSRSKSSKRQRIASSTGSGGDVAHSGPALGLQDELSAPARPAPSLPPQPLRPAVSSSTSLLPRPGGRTSRASSASPGRSPSPDFDLDFSGGGSLSGLLDGDPINDLSGNSANSYGTSSSDVSCGTGSSGDIGGTSDPASSGLASSDNAGGNSTGDISMTPIPATSSIDVSPLHGDKSAPSSEAEPMSSPDPAGTVTSFSSSGEDAAPLVNPVSGAEVLSMDVSAGSADKLQDEAPIENDVRNKPKPRLRIVNPITSANLDAQRKATTLAATDVQPPATDSTPTAVPEHARNTSPGPGQEEPSARESEPAASKTNATSSRKFRPGPKDTARNLYGRDYMKKHKDTTTAEFKTIWDELDETTKEAWAQKAKQLQDAKKSAASSA